jgi:hypothetical protein
MALQVIIQTNNGMTVVDACREVGLPRSSFYEIVKRNPAIIMEFQEYVRGKELEELKMILASNLDILEKTIADGLSKTISPKERLAILKMLSDRLDKLAAKYLAHNRNDDAARKILTGPKLVQVKSRFSAENPGSPTQPS